MSAATQFTSRIATATALKPVYLIAGDEHLLVIEAADALRSRARALHALFGDLAVGKKARAEADATHVQAFEPLGREALADDEFGAAAADVDDEAVTAFVRRRVRDAEMDQARFFDARDDFDGMTERVAGTLEEHAAALGLAQGVGCLLYTSQSPRD